MRILNKDMLELGLKLQNDFDIKYVEYNDKVKFNHKNNIKEDVIFPNKHGDVIWGRDKEVGSLYHAYCAFSSILEHGYEEGFFEDCAYYRQENESVARKLGWVIGKKETTNVAICPSCKEKLKNNFKKIEKDIMNKIGESNDTN